MLRHCILRIIKKEQIKKEKADLNQVGFFVIYTLRIKLLPNFFMLLPDFTHPIDAYH
jgi:hypothetical protein